MESNARIARYDAHQLSDLFDAQEIDCVYVNHPDPWPKDRHAKNRLLSASFFHSLAALVKPGGEFRLKTDHVINVQAAMDHPEQGVWELLGRSDDVNGLGAPWPLDVATNYQKKFLKKNEPVYAVWLRRI